MQSDKNRFLDLYKVEFIPILKVKPKRQPSYFHPNLSIERAIANISTTCSSFFR